MKRHLVFSVRNTIASGLHHDLIATDFMRFASSLAERRLDIKFGNLFIPSHFHCCIRERNTHLKQKKFYVNFITKINWKKTEISDNLCDTELFTLN